MLTVSCTFLGSNDALILSRFEALAFVLTFLAGKFSSYHRFDHRTEGDALICVIDTPARRYRDRYARFGHLFYKRQHFVIALTAYAIDVFYDENVATFEFTSLCTAFEIVQLATRCAICSAKSGQAFIKQNTVVDQQPLFFCYQFPTEF